MLFKQINNSGVMIVYEGKNTAFGEDMYSYLVSSEDRIYICDTHLGPESMKPIKKYIKEQEMEDKKILIFNSHADWDHIWGNCAFDQADIIGHEICRDRIMTEGEETLEKNEKFRNGIVQIVPPNITFKQKLTYIDDGIEFIHTPGHTIDSAISYDKKNSVVFVGDLIEYPIPFTNHRDLKDYINSLTFIKGLGANTIVSAHSGIVSEELYNNNLKYIKDLYNKNEISNGDELFMAYHQSNVKSLAEN